MHKQQDGSLEGRTYRVVLEKTGLPHEIKMSLIWEESNYAIHLGGMLTKMKELVGGIAGIEDVEISGDNRTLLIWFKEDPFADETVIADLLKAMLEEFPIERIIVQCDRCARIEQRVNQREETTTLD